MQKQITCEHRIHFHQQVNVNLMLKR